MDSTIVLHRLAAAVDMDREFLEILVPYLERLLAIGIDFSFLPLQDAIEGHPYHLEAACQAVTGYAGWLAGRGEGFSDRTHATHCFIQALVDQWQPYPDWQEHSQRAEQAKYVSPYEKALRLMYELNQRSPSPLYQPAALDVLSDAEIETMLPELEQQWSWRVGNVELPKA